MKNLIILTILCLVFTSGALGQPTQEKTHPIDSLYKACLDSSQNQNTWGKTHCATQARDAWDKETSRYLKLLGEMLTSEENNTLQHNQQQWIAYRDKEVALASTLYGKLSDMKWRSEAFVRQYEILKQRALDLKAYYEVLKENSK